MNSNLDRCGVITCILARHAREALALGRSLRLNSPATPAVCVVEGTLSSKQEQQLRGCFDDIVFLRPEHHRMGWLVKHTMLHYTPFDRTLFVDSDCLVMRDLRPAFATFGERAVAFAAKSNPEQETGRALYSGISLENLLQRFGADWWPQIAGGGHFYFRRNDEARAIFERALYWGKPEVIAPFGWTNPKKVAPDELTLQIALVEAGQGRACAVTEFPLVCWTPWYNARPDVFSQRISLRDRTSGRRSWDTRYFIAHFGGDAHNPAFVREQWRLHIWQPTGESRAAAPSLAGVAKPVFHVAAEAARKGRHGWNRAWRTLRQVSGG